MHKLNDYRGIVDDQILQEIKNKAEKLNHAKIVHVNSTHTGGGVAEMLATLIPLLNDAGLLCDWRVLHGTSDFFTVTKKLHNALQSEEVDLEQIEKEIYLSTNEDFSCYAHLDQDAVIIHDPQPLPLIQFYPRVHQPWIWRCHVDLSAPDQTVWDFLKPLISRYDRVIVSKDNYLPGDFPVPRKIIRPVIDPLTLKNRELSEEEIERCLTRFEVPLDKPLITQISRFDKWKDPEGVIEVFAQVKKEVDCRLVLCGNMASDDPEGIDIYERVSTGIKDRFAKNDVILLTVANNELVNSLQRRSSVIIQKSLKEGFGLTVTEAMWKCTPVVASKVGGIVLQIEDGKNGYLVAPQDTATFAERTIDLLQNPAKAKKIGHEGRETVRQNYLMPRLVNDYLDLLTDLLIPR